VETSGVASVLAASIGVPKDRAATLIMASCAALALLLVELLAHLAGVAARLIGRARAGVDELPAEVVLHSRA